MRGAERRYGVVFDVNVLVAAVTAGNSPFVVWPAAPPASDNPAADCVGVANDAREFALWLSDHIVHNVVRVLCAERGFGWPAGEAEQYARVLVDVAEASGGGVATPTQTVNDCSDYEDNRVLELALECGADLIVSGDHHLLEMSPWRGRPILGSREFASRVEVMRRAQRRGPR